MLLGHELRYWTKTAKAAGLDGILPNTLSRQVLARASAQDEEIAGRLIDLVADRPRQLAGHAAQIATATERPEPLVTALERIVADPTASAVAFGRMR